MVTTLECIQALDLCFEVSTIGTICYRQTFVVCSIHCLEKDWFTKNVKGYCDSQRYYINIIIPKLTLKFQQLIRLNLLPKQQIKPVYRITKYQALNIIYQITQSKITYAIHVTEVTLNGFKDLRKKIHLPNQKRFNKY